MDFATAVQTCFRKYIVFSGRAQRSEYWYWVLFVVLANIAVSFLEAVINDMATGNAGLLNAAFSIAIMLPGISVVVRRLHDTNRSGWWYWIVLVPIVGIIVLLVWLVTKGSDGPNDFGHDPLDDTWTDHSGPDDNGGNDSADLRPSDLPSVKRRR
jgi:uncharacterized membrane protein YhaH (DUF805 family)